MGDILTTVRRLQSDVEHVKSSFARVEIGDDHAETLERWKELFLDDLFSLVESMGGLFETFYNEIEAQAEALEDIAEQQGDMISPQLSAMILHAFKLANMICDLVTSGVNDEFTAKKVAGLIKEFRRHQYDTTKEVLSATVDDDDLEQENSDGTDNGDRELGDDGADGDDASEEEAGPAA